jgi:L-lactate dehydrogenase
MKGKISIIGAGYVGSTAAYALLMSGISSEIALIDINKEKAEGEAMDLRHGLQFVPQTDIVFNEDFKTCRHSDIVIVCAGANSKPGESRLDLVGRNARIFKDLIPKIAKCNKNSIIIVVSNPVDVLTYLAIKYSGFPASRVFGTGTVLDTARFRYFLGEHYGVNPNSVHAFILGEHGNSEFPVWSSANIAGVKMANMRGYSRKKMDAIFKKTKNAAYEIIDRKGATYYAIGLVITKIVKAILSDSNEVLPVSCLLKNYQGVSDVCLSIPAVINRSGISKQILLPLDGNEKRSLKKSADLLKGVIKKVK